MLITKKIEIDMGHRVPNHKSKCSNPHGHRYVIEVGVDDKVIDVKGDSNEGMVIDFSDLKQAMMEVLDEVYDHSYTIYNNDCYLLYFEKMKLDGRKINIVDFIPTAENLSKQWFKEMNIKLVDFNIKLNYITVWETPTSTATYTIEDFKKDKPKEQKSLYDTYPEEV